MMSKIFYVLLFTFFAGQVFGQVYIERRGRNGSYSIELNPNYRCNVPADARRCDRDPNICNGKDFCESSNSSRWTRWRHTSGTFKARGYGNTCAEAKRAAVAKLYENEGDLCGRDGKPTCLNGRSPGPCYHNGRKFVSWYVCYNDRSGGQAPSNGAFGFLLFEWLRRPRS